MQTTKQYAHFGQRFFAMLIDNIIFGIILSPIFMMLFGSKTYTQKEVETILNTQGVMGLIDPKEMFIQQLVVLSITLFFWVRFAGTPGKRLLKLKVIDATTGNKLTPLQSLVRYLGYFISAFPMGLGFLWVVMDEKNQGWHDKLANSVVIREDVNTSGESRSQREPYDSPQKDDDTFAA